MNLLANATSAPLALLLAVAAGYVAAHVAFDWIARRFLIVSAAEYLVLGILLGPRVAGIVGTPILESLSPIVTLAIGWIGVLVGTRFELRRLLFIPARWFRVAIVESAITFTIVGGLEYFLIHWWLTPSTQDATSTAVALGALAVASSSVGVATIAKLVGTRAGIVEQLELSSAINAAVAIAIFGWLLCLTHAPGPLARPLTTTEWVAMSVVIGVGAGTLFHIFLGETATVDRMFIALGGGVVLVSGAAAYLRLSPLFTGFFFGLTLVNTTREPEPLIDALRRVEEPLYYVLLLFGGAGWRPSERAWLAPVLVFVIARLVAKIGGSRLAARANGAIGELGPQWGRATLGQGRLALAIGLNFVNQQTMPFQNVVFTAAITSIVLTEFASARLARSVVIGPNEGAQSSSKTAASHPRATRGAETLANANNA